MKRSDATFLREMIGFAGQRLMELEVGEVTGAAHGERKRRTDMVGILPNEAASSASSAPFSSSSPTSGPPSGPVT